jgi:hypothetical protein
MFQAIAMRTKVKMRFVLGLGTDDISEELANLSSSNK